MVGYYVRSFVSARPKRQSVQSATESNAAGRACQFVSIICYEHADSIFRPGEKDHAIACCRPQLHCGGLIVAATAAAAGDTSEISCYSRKTSHIFCQASFRPYAALSAVYIFHSAFCVVNILAFLHWLQNHYFDLLLNK